jgi:hypothetical protein
MKRIFIIATLVSMHPQAQSQVDVGISPRTTLQLVGDPGAAAIADGITAPRLTGNELKTKNLSALSDSLVNKKHH